MTEADLAACEADAKWIYFGGGFRTYTERRLAGNVLYLCNALRAAELVSDRQVCRLLIAAEAERGRA